MATDRFNQLHEDANTTVQSGVSLLKTAVGLSPVAAGIWYGQRRLKANEAVNTPIMRATPSQTMGQAQGLAARRQQRARNAQAAKVAEALRNGMNNSQELREIVADVGEHKALLQALSVTLEDPASGLDLTRVKNFKREIDNLLVKNAPNSVEEFTERVVNSLLSSGTDETLLKWRENLGEFRAIGSQLQAPDFSIPKRSAAYNQIDMATIRGQQYAKGTWQRRALDLEAAFAGHENVRVNVSRINEGDMIFHQAQIEQRGKWQTSIGLSNENFVRSGQSFNTLYATPKKALNIQAAYQWARGRGADPSKMSLDDLRGSGALQDYADYMVSEVGRRARAGHMDWSSFREEQALAWQHVNRAAMAGDTLGKHILNQAIGDTNTIYGHSLGALPTDVSMDFLSRLGMGVGLEAGGTAKRILTGFGTDRRSIIGLAAGSGFEQLQSYYASIQYKN